MVIELKELKKRGIETQTFMFLYDCENYCDIPNVEIVNPVKVNGSVTLVDNKNVYVEAEVAFTLKGACTRCARLAEQTVIAKINDEFSSIEGSESYTYKNEKIDLTKAVCDAVILAMPEKVLCKSDCKGVCFNCGVNLNDGDCECEKS